MLTTSIGSFFLRKSTNPMILYGFIFITGVMMTALIVSRHSSLTRRSVLNKKSNRKGYTGMTSEAMTTAVSNFTDIIGDVMTMVGGNPILLTVFCSGLVMVAIKAVKKLVKIGR